jgi:hypothetical protein
MTKKEHLFNKIHICVFSFFLLMPGFCQASVFINEIAWMGSESSANHEWIELFNDSSALSVAGWTLTDGRNLSIELSGTIPSNTYAVLERTSDDSAPGTAFLVYTGALSNTGGSLRLENAEGQLVDLVNGGDAWEQIGGDNVTKETAQYSTKGWITAKATPGSQNKSVSSSVEITNEEVVEKDSKITETKKKVQTVRLTLPEVSLALDIDAQTVGYVNQIIPFLSEASNVGKSLLGSLEYKWNFGDGNISARATSSHRFRFPGTYIVTLHAEYKRQKQVARHEITILPVTLSLTQNSQGDIQINNDSPYEIDISGYKLKAQETFVFPAYSLILPSQTVTVPRNKVASKSGVMVAVYDTHGISLASILPIGISFDSRVYATAEPARITTQTDVADSFELLAGRNSVTQPVVVSPPVSMEAVPALETKEMTKEVPVIENKTTGPRVINRNERFSYVGLAVIILLGIFGVYLTPRRNKMD